MSTQTAQEFDESANHQYLEIEKGLIQFEQLFDAACSEQLTFESFLETLPQFPNTLNSFQIELSHLLTNNSKRTFVSTEGYSDAVVSVLTQEALEELSRDKAKDIIKGSQSVIDWLFSVLDHLNETVDKFASQTGELSHRLEPIANQRAAKGSFIYKSISRNLGWHQVVTPSTIPGNLDKFLTKAHTVRSSVDAPSFNKLVQEIKSFKSGPSESENQRELDQVFKALKTYLQTILPNKTSKALYHLEMIQDRELVYDSAEYIGGHRFYAYVPTSQKGAVATVTSGIVRTEQDTDLKQEIPYLSPKEALAILETIKHHLYDFNDVQKFKIASIHLRELQTQLFNKYSQAKRMRKDHVDPKPYVVLMNITGGLLYGMHVKALNKSVSVINAALRYVSKSVSALEKELAQINPPYKES